LARLTGFTLQITNNESMTGLTSDKQKMKPQKNSINFFSEHKKIRSYFLYFIRISFGVGILFFVFDKNQIKFENVYSQGSHLLIFQLFLIQVFIFIISCLRWKLIIKSFSAQDLKFKKTLLISWIGQFMSSFLPGIIATDISRLHYINKIYPGFKTNLKTILIDRAVSLTSFGVLCVSTGIAFVQDWSFLLYLFLSLALLLVTIFGVKIYAAKYKIPVSAFLISYVSFSLKAFSLFYIVIYLKLSEGYSDLFYLSMLGQVSDPLHLTPANVGVGHLVYEFVFNLAPGLAGAMIYQYYFTSVLIFKLTGGLGWMFFKVKK